MKVLSFQHLIKSLTQFYTLALGETMLTSRLHRNLLAQGKAQVIARNLSANFPRET